MAKRTKKKTNSSEAEFVVGDLVGAKIKGHPLWPGQIEKIDVINARRKYTVRFFGTNDTSQTFIQIKYFKDFTQQEKNCTRKGFKDALTLCQEKYDSQSGTQISDDVSDSEKTPSSSSPDQKAESEETRVKEETHDTSPEEKDDDEVDDKSLVIDTHQPRIANKRKRTVAQVPDPPTEDKEPRTKRSKPLLGVKKEPEHVESSRAKGENLLVKSTIQTTIAKLEEKVAQKMKEKEALKSEKASEKVSQKVRHKFKKIAEVLNRFIRIVHKILNQTSSSKVTPDQWKNAIDRYYSVITVLSICLQHAKNSPCDSFEEGQECRKTLIQVVELIDATKHNKKVPLGIHKELKSCKRATRSDRTVKDFINDGLDNHKNAMIERKENDAEC